MNDRFGTTGDNTAGSRQMAAFGQEADVNSSPGSAYEASPTDEKQSFSLAFPDLASPPSLA